ncbi:unnamed protein product [Lota lota]
MGKYLLDTVPSPSPPPVPRCRSIPSAVVLFVVKQRYVEPGPCAAQGAGPSPVEDNRGHRHQSKIGRREKDVNESALLPPGLRRQ